MKNLDVGTYRIVSPKEFTPEQLEVLKRVSRERVTERVCALIGQGKLSVSQVQAKYGKIMNLVGRA
jgi:hypothetical protein